MTPIKEIEKRLVEMEFKDFYRWIVINMPRLSGADKKLYSKNAWWWIVEFCTAFHGTARRSTETQFRATDATRCSK
jgi:hypothetical protein